MIYVSAHLLAETVASALPPKKKAKYKQHLEL